MTTPKVLQEPLDEALEEWGFEFMDVARAVADHGLQLLDAPEDQVPYELLAWAMATMQTVSRPLRAVAEELFPLSDELKASIDKMFESSNKVTYAAPGDVPSSGHE